MWGVMRHRRAALVSAFVGRRARFSGRPQNYHPAKEAMSRHAHAHGEIHAVCFAVCSLHLPTSSLQSLHPHTTSPISVRPGLRGVLRGFGGDFR